jgi:hypothetical protein
MTRTLVVAAVAAVPILAASPASAQAIVSKADYSAGTLKIEGRAIWDRPITVDGVVLTTSDAGGNFTISRSGYTPPADCTVDVSDGSLTAAVVRLPNCTPTVQTAAIAPDRAELGPFTAGVTIPSTTVSLVGGIGPTTWQITAGTLPPGLGMYVPQPNTGLPRPITDEQKTYALIQGTPTTPGTSTVTFRVVDANGLTATRTYTITIGAALPLSITPQPWPSLTIDSFSNLWIDGNGGVRPYTWVVTDGALPPGMTLIQDAADGPSVRVGGTPTTAGTYTWTLGLTDVHGATASRTFTATVAEPAAPAPEPTPIPTPEPAPVFLSVQSLSLNPTTVAGGTTSTGTVTLTTAAPAGGTAVILSSRDTAIATVPATVTVPAGATSATFPITTATVTSTTTTAIEATWSGTLVANLTVTAPATATPADTVSIGRAEYDSAKRQLRVDASSSRTGATLQVFDTATNALIGTLSAGTGQFTLANAPQSITVRSSLGGSATRTVTLR